MIKVIVKYSCNMGFFVFFGLFFLALKTPFFYKKIFCFFLFTNKWAA